MRPFVQLATVLSGSQQLNLAVLVIAANNGGRQRTPRVPAERVWLAGVRSSRLDALVSSPYNRTYSNRGAQPLACMHDRRQTLATCRARPDLARACSSQLLIMPASDTTASPPRSDQCGASARALPSGRQ